MEKIKRVAPSKATVLVTGESGVGKEGVADAIHQLSPRKDKPLIKVHCAALSESLLESELFGHEEGAFTGADKMQKGRFELAHEGTIFLDEIGEISPAVQVKLLRVIQNRQFERVGGEKTIDVDVRIIAATNRNLEEEVRAGRFREDLYYRLNVVSVDVPPLRERKEDIPLLISSFLEKFNKENGKEVKGFDSKARSAMTNYMWPGNIRQLQNVVEGCVAMSISDTVKLSDLPDYLQNGSVGQTISIPMGTTMDEAEMIIIQETLASVGGNISKCAEVLGIGRKTLYRKLGEEE